ncbi:MAG: cysteine desulfurase [Erysipelotrichaceae bacterium]|nr:cysteine desulfurase [Erysipelotrichaceae bacterium]
MKIYLDAVSTTALDPEVRETYVRLLNEYYCNSDALYDDGVAIYDMQEKARAHILEALKLRDKDLIFTSGASEANSLAIKGYCLKQKEKKHVITSYYEHSSVYNAFRQLEEQFGFDVTYLMPDEEGHITAEAVGNALRNDTCLVSIMAVNNEIGAINDIAEIARTVKKHPGTLFHTDITQAIGKIPLDLKDADMASFSAHKIHGLKGSGALIKKSYIELLPQISGGQQEYSMRGGTSNALVNIVLAKTVRLALEHQQRDQEKLLKMHDHLIEGFPEQVSINYDRGVITLVNVSTPIPSEVLLNALNKEGIMVSSKSTCGSRKNELNRSLSSMNFDEDHAIRISFDHTNTIEELDRFNQCLKEIIKKYA